MTDKLLTPKEIAALLGFKLKTIHSWASQGRIPHLKIGGRLRFDEAVIREWMKQFAEDEIVKMPRTGPGKR